MRRVVAFADVLERKLTTEERPAAGRQRETAMPIATMPLFSLDPPSALKAAPGGVVPFAAVISPISKPSSPRARRLLTPLQRQALECLVAAGAALDADAGFSADEIRRAFRQLARRYHPDRHPHSTAADKARLSRVFADLLDAYRPLQPVAAEAA